MNRGFTLIELLVVISIIVLITTITLPNSRSGDRQLTLQRAGAKLSQDLRRVQEMAMSSRQISGAPSSFDGGYGIYFNINQPNQYILFADFDNGNDYDAGEALETLQLENEITIYGLFPATPLAVVFYPPNPITTFSPDADTASIRLKIEGEEVESDPYIYSYVQIRYDWLDTRASCDWNFFSVNCSDTFSASLSGEELVYDWYGFPIIYERSREYEKIENELVSPSEKRIEINKAGLISVD